MKIVAAENELHKVAEALLSKSSFSNIICFRGEMGAGKTTLIKNICNFLGVKDEVSSPTFSIVNEYETNDNERLYHFDFYRLEEEEEALDMGVEEYFYSDKLCLIEWPSKVESLLPEKRIELLISVLQEKREFIINEVD
jgi:tRNA threonylcarbamoyladenosine biosynthesis protein TsaE